MRRLATIVCTATLALAALAGCGSDNGDGDSNVSGSSGGDYCDQVKDVEDTLKQTAGPDATLDDLQTQTDSMQAVSDAAPDEVSKNWSNLADYSQQSVSALQDAGLDSEKPLQAVMAEMQKQDPQEAKKVTDSMPEQPASLKSDSAAIQKQVKDECDIDLGASTAQ